ncbi:MAG: aldo/keto reductase [Bacteroidota bacterium]
MVSKVPVAPEGLELSRIILGMWRLADQDLSTDQVIELIEYSQSLGVTSFDHADLYGDYTCEGIFGKALKEKPALRDDMQIISKCGIKLISKNRLEHEVKYYDTSKAHITWSVENSLKELNTDRLDLLLIHRPDPLTDPDEVAEAFVSLQTSGKVLHFGVSNFTPSQFDLLQSRLPMPLVTNQIELSLIHSDPFFDSSVDHMYQHHVAPMAWSPLAGGRLFGTDTQAIALREKIETLAGKYNCSIDQILIAWLLRHPSGVLPVIGTGKLERIKSAAGALSIELNRQDWFRMLEWARGEEVP